MEVNATEALDLDHDADVGAARRRFAALAVTAGLDESRSNDAAMIASELASNVIKHARHGGILFGCVREGGVKGVSIVAWDRGGGMDLDACMRDGMSTSGTAGNGLGAITRLASRWDAHTRGGVVLAAYVFPKGAPKPKLDVAGVAEPYPGLHVCGEAWSHREHGERSTLMVCDGLGHGEGAQTASRTVIAAFEAHAEAPLATILDRAHTAAKHTRGAAATVVRVDRAAREATIAGVGNVSAWIVHDSTKQLVTQHGTLGQTAPHAIREERYPFPPGAILVVASDGLKTRLPFEDNRDLLARSSLTVAAGLWRDHTRGRDDATAVVLREAR